MIVEIADDLGRALISAGVAREISDVEADFVSAGFPHELCEADMACVLDISASALHKRRERQQCEGLYRTVGRQIVYSTPLTMRAFRVRSPDIDE
jgi:hypothetical protein